MAMLRQNMTNITSTTLFNNQTNSTGKIPITQGFLVRDSETFFVCLLLGIMVVAENSLVCLAFAVNQKLRKRQANILVCSQACADLFNGLVFVPIEIYERYRNQKLLTPYLIAYVLFVSLFNLFSLALDRYLALIKPLLHHLIMDVSRTKKLLILNWVMPLVITAIPLCWSTSSVETAAISSRVYVCIFWLFMFCLCVVMIVMYVLIYQTAAKTIRQRQKRIARLNKDPENKLRTTKTELRVAHLFGLLLFFFILAYLPILYLNLMDILGQIQLIFPIMEKLSLYSLIVNSAVNPVLCLLLKKDYQAIIKRWICFEWITEKWRSESIRSQASYKTVMENTDAHDSSSDSTKKKRFSRGYSFRRSEQSSQKFTDFIRSSLKRQRQGNSPSAKDRSDKKSTPIAAYVKSGDDRNGIRASNVQRNKEEDSGLSSGKSDQSPNKPDLLCTNADLSFSKADASQSRSDVSCSKSGASWSKPDPSISRSVAFTSKLEQPGCKSDPSCRKSGPSSIKADPTCSKPDSARSTSDLSIGNSCLPCDKPGPSSEKPKPQKAIRFSQVAQSDDLTKITNNTVSKSRMKNFLRSHLGLTEKKSKQEPDVDEIELLADGNRIFKSSYDVSEEKSSTDFNKTLLCQRSSKEQSTVRIKE